VITGIGYLQLFEEPFVMTGGGPLDRTLSVTMLVYEQGFNFLNLGYASAIAYALFVAIVVLTVVNFRLLRADT
jgi:multiple sugar transport system permease protein